MDKYQILKKIIYVGIAINIYFGYESLTKYLILTSIKDQIIQKRKQFD